MKTFESGNHSESIVLGAYLKAGFIVSIPFGSGAVYNLLVDSGSKIFKIQVKTAWISKGVVLKYKSLRRQPKTETRIPYKDSEIDYLAIYCPANNSLYGFLLKIIHQAVGCGLNQLKMVNQKLLDGLQIIFGKNTLKN